MTRKEKADAPKHRRMPEKADAHADSKYGGDKHRARRHVLNNPNDRVEAGGHHIRQLFGYRIEKLCNPNNGKGQEQGCVTGPRKMKKERKSKYIQCSYCVYSHIPFVIDTVNDAAEGILKTF